MAKFHIDKNGKPGICKATKGNCPLGGAEEHFSNQQEAQQYADTKNEKEHELLPNISKKQKTEIGKERLNELFEELVPSSGKSESVAGELVRAASRINYRFFNDGDQVNREYGNETCNGSLRYITQQLDKLENGQETSDAFHRLWNGNILDEDEYEGRLDTCMAKMAEFIDSNPELRTNVNEDDSVADFSQPEDYNYDYEEEEEYDDEWDEEDDVDAYGNSWGED